MAIFAKKCPCLRPKIEDEVRVLDYKHSSLHDVPSEVFNKERTLEELYVDCNQIRDLPRELFFCHGLRKLSISDNEITDIPPAIASLGNLEELDFSKNGIIEVPDNIKGCKYLRYIDASVNPLGKLPESFTHLTNLTHLYLNDTFLEFLPGSFGRMVRLKILEMRENHIKALPRSFARLTQLERLDIGNNEFTELSDVISGLGSLLELWCDNNQITTISRSIGKLKHLMFLDASNNRLQELPEDIDGCTSLADLHLTNNSLVELPETIGHLKNLITLKVDDNQLTYLPQTLGGLSSLSELNASANDLEHLPASIGLLRNLRTFYADDNLLRSLPAEIGSCSGITVMSLRSNKLTYLPDELGRIPRLRVLNLSDNLLHYLPFSFVKLKELQALWLSENQTRPLIPLQSEYDATTGRKILTCYLLPQGQLGNINRRDHTEDTQSFHPSMWEEERLQRQQIHFDFVDDIDEEGSLVRCPTPYPKEMRQQRGRHALSLAMKQAINSSDRASNGAATSGTMADDNDTMILGVLDKSEQQDFVYSRRAECSDLKPRDIRITNSATPRLHESHFLYRHDKEKLLKDKAHMRHRLSVPDFESGLNGLVKDVKNQNKKVKSVENRMSSHSGSVPDLSSRNRREIPSVSTTGDSAPTTSLVNDDHCYKQIVHHQHRRRKSRRLREYDSEADFHSDYELVALRQETGDDSSQGTNCEILSVQSQPLPLHYSHQKHTSTRWRDTADCSSDVGVYGGRGSFPTANAAAAAFQRKFQLGQLPKQNCSYTTPHPQSPAPDFPKNSSLSSVLYKCDNSTRSDRNSQHRKVSELKENSRHRSEYSTSRNRTSHPTVLKDHARTHQDVLEDINNRVYSDELYNNLPSKKYYPQLEVKQYSALDVSKKNYCSLNQSSKDYYSSNHTSTELVEANNSRISFQPHLTSGPTIQVPSSPDPASKQNFLFPDQSQMLACKPKVNGMSGSNLSLQHSSATPSPTMDHQDSLEEQTNQAPLALAESSTSLSSVDHKGSKHEVFKKRTNSQKCLSSDQSSPTHWSAVVPPTSHQSPVVPPPYNPAPPYRRPSGNSGLLRHTNRLSNDSVSGCTNSLRDAANLSDAPKETLLNGSSSSIQNVNQSQTTHHGFNGSNPHLLYPAPSKEVLSFTNYADLDWRRRNRDRGCDSYRPHRDSNNQRSSSKFPQIGSTSQAGSDHPPGTGSAEQDRPDSPDSQSNLHHPPSFHESPQFSSAYGSSGSSPGEDPPHHHYSPSLEAGNFDELSTGLNQEQSSQVSSSTDSGYDHGHHVYELIGDHCKSKGNDNNGEGDSGSYKFKKISSTPSQRLMPGKRSHKVWSKDSTPVKDFPMKTPAKEHKEQFQITIKKSPGLGFSIAGGIGSHGNPFRAEDIGIFVTKVVPQGPASKFLQPGDKILQVNKVDFQVIDHNQAVAVLKRNNIVTLLIERVQKVDVV